MSLFIFSPFLTAYMLALAFVVGACMGSFVLCAVTRKIERRSMFERSCCPFCGRKLSATDLFPIFSFLFLKGRCRYCKQKLGVKYLLVEVLFALGYLGLFARFGLSLDALKFIILFTLLAAASLNDIITNEIPDLLLIFSAADFLVFSLLGAEPLKTVLSGILCGVGFGAAILILVLIMDRIFKRETMGGGDIKMFAVLGLFFGPAEMLLLIISSCVFGLIFSFASKKGLWKTFPFAPSLTLTAYFCALAAKPIISWYFGLFVL